MCTEQQSNAKPPSYTVGAPASSLVLVGFPTPGQSHPLSPSLWESAAAPDLAWALLSSRAAVAVLQAVFSKALPAAAQELDAEGVWDLLVQPSSCLKGVALLAR